MNRKITPVRFLRENIYETLPPHKKRRMKVSKEEFVIPEYGEHDKFLKINFNCMQLREIARFYKQKRTGNKPHLMFLLYNFLKYSKYARTIQRIFRGYLCRYYYKLRGPAFRAPLNCVNETDFITLERLDNIPKKQLMTYKDKDGHLFGFDICSLYNLFSHKTAAGTNPYTRENFSQEFRYKVQRILKLSKVFGDTINIVIEDTYKGLSREKQMELFCVSIFQKIDDLGNHSNPQCFLSLNRLYLIKFVRELMDIWVYRANLSLSIKQKICPPYGNPFLGFNITQLHSNLPIVTLKHNILKVMENFVVKGIDRDSKVLGALYILTALTLVSPDAAEARPELYNSAAPF